MTNIYWMNTTEIVILWRIESQLSIAILERKTGIVSLQLHITDFAIGGYYLNEGTQSPENFTLPALMRNESMRICFNYTFFEHDTSKLNINLCGTVRQITPPDDIGWHYQEYNDINCGAENARVRHMQVLRQYNI